MTGVDRLAILCATGFGLGRVAVAPGTVGSIPGLALGGLVHLGAARLTSGPPWSALVTVLALGLVAGGALWAIGRMEAVLSVHDDRAIVADEIAGQAIAVALVTPAPLPYLAGFLAFRLLDIAKPSLIGKIDREVKGAWGTLGDDLLAGMLAAPVAYAAAWI